MRLTRPSTLAALAMLAGLAAWLGMALWEDLTGSLPGVPRTAPVGLLLAAAIVLSVAVSLRSRLHAQREAARLRDDAQRPGTGGVPTPAAPPRDLANRPAPGRRARPVRPVNPFVAARAVAMAKACSHVGAVVGGFYAGFGAYLLADLGTALRRERALICGMSVVAATLLVAASLWLERICRLPDDGLTVGGLEDDDVEPPTPTW